MRLVSPPLLVLVLCAALLAGCGGSDDGGGDTRQSGGEPQAGSSAAPPGASAKSCKSRSAEAEDLRATNLSCGQARVLMSAWQDSRDCSAAGGASRTSCRIEPGYNCLTADTGRGTSVSCAKPGHSVAFLVPKGKKG